MIGALNNTAAGWKLAVNRPEKPVEPVLQANTRQDDPQDREAAHGRQPHRHPLQGGGRPEQSAAHPAEQAPPNMLPAPSDCPETERALAVLPEEGSRERAAIDLQMASVRYGASAAVLETINKMQDSLLDTLT
jgi:hypothetical protein